MITKNLGEREDIHEDSERGYRCVVGILSQLVNRSLKCTLYSKFLLIVEPKSTRYILLHFSKIVLRNRTFQCSDFFYASERRRNMTVCRRYDEMVGQGKFSKLGTTRRSGPRTGSAHLIPSRSDVLSS